jgi:hypothetical protein
VAFPSKRLAGKSTKQFFYFKRHLGENSLKYKLFTGITNGGSQIYDPKS